MKKTDSFLIIRFSDSALYVKYAWKGEVAQHSTPYYKHTTIASGILLRKQTENYGPVFLSSHSFLFHGGCILPSVPKTESGSRLCAMLQGHFERAPSSKKS